MQPAQSSLPVLEPATADFLTEAVAGLSQSPPTLPCKFFYDEGGSELFLQICDLPEYYVTRTELLILKEHGAEIADELGAGLELIGLGTGAGTKTRLLVEKLRDPIAYVPVDISREQLEQSSALFRKLFPTLEVLPVCADYLQPVILPAPSRTPRRRVIYFPGSTIGNFEPMEARAFLQRVQRICAPGDGLLIGVDLKKDRKILERAYNDAAGITAAFNLNLLVRANKELGADFDLHHWRHRAVFNETESRIEMHLISDVAQTVHLGGREFQFAAGEKIITEFSYKHSRASFIALAGAAGFDFRQLWTDDEQLFGVFLFQVNA